MNRTLTLYARKKIHLKKLKYCSNEWSHLYSPTIRSGGNKLFWTRLINHDILDLCFPELLGAKPVSLLKNRPQLQPALNHMINTMAANSTDRNKILSTIQQICQTASMHAVSGDTLQNLLTRLVEEGRKIVGARYAAITLFDDQNNFQLFFQSGLEPVLFEKMKKMFGTPQGKGLFHYLRTHPDQVLRLENIQDHPASAGFPAGHPPMKAFLGVPLAIQQQYLGQVYFADRQDDQPFSEEDETWAINFAQLASMVIYNAKLLDDVSRQKKKLEIMHRVASAAASCSTPAEVAKATLAAMINEEELKISDKGAIFLNDAAGKRVVMLAQHNFPQSMQDLCPQVPYGDCLCGLAAEAGQPMYCSNCLQDDLHSRRLPEMKSHGHAVLPLLVQDRLIGVLCLYLDAGREASPMEKDIFVSLANIIAVAMENALHTDTLEQKVHERTIALELARDEAEAANRAKSSFLANMSHELRTPLNAVIGFSNILFNGMAGVLSEDQREYVKDIKESGDHLLKLINEILDLAKIEAGKMVLQPTEIDVAEIMQSSLMFIKEKTLKHSIEVQQDIAADVGLITLDETRFKQALVNLLDNAAKFTPDHGRITVTARRLAVADLPHHLPAARSPEIMTAAAYLFVSVVDTGRGLSAEDLNKLFQPFFQAGSVLVGKPEGTGLGLILSRRIVEQHGGCIWAASGGEGTGAEFSFVIPYALKDTDAAAGTGLQGMNVSWSIFIENAKAILAYHRRHGRRMGICRFIQKQELSAKPQQEFCRILALRIRTYEILVNRSGECFLVLLDVDQDKLTGAVDRLQALLAGEGYAAEIRTVLFPDNGDTIEQLVQELLG